MIKCWIKYGTPQERIEQAFRSALNNFVWKGERAEKLFNEKVAADGLYRTLKWEVLDLMTKLKEAEIAKQLLKEYTSDDFQWTNDDGTPCNAGEEILNIYEYYVTVLFDEIRDSGSVEHELARKAAVQARRNVLKRMLEIIEYGA